MNDGTENVPNPGETNEKPEPNHISGRPFAKKGNRESIEGKNDELGSSRNDKESKRSTGWNQMPKEKATSKAPDTGIE